MKVDYYDREDMEAMDEYEEWKEEVMDEEDEVTDHYYNE